MMVSLPRATDDGTNETIMWPEGPRVFVDQ